jgi:hypothetical protein
MNGMGCLNTGALGFTAAPRKSTHEIADLRLLADARLTDSQRNSRRIVIWRGACVRGDYIPVDSHLMSPAQIADHATASVRLLMAATNLTTCSEKRGPKKSEKKGQVYFQENNSPPYSLFCRALGNYSKTILRKPLNEAKCGDCKEP